MFLTIELCTELFEIELIIYIKIYPALNNLEKTHPTNQASGKYWILLML